MSSIYEISQIRDFSLEDYTQYLQYVERHDLSNQFQALSEDSSLEFVMQVFTRCIKDLQTQPKIIKKVLNVTPIDYLQSKEGKKLLKSAEKVQTLKPFISKIRDALRSFDNKLDRDVSQSSSFSDHESSKDHCERFIRNTSTEQKKQDKHLEETEESTKKRIILKSKQKITSTRKSEKLDEKTTVGKTVSAGKILNKYKPGPRPKYEFSHLVETNPEEYKRLWYLANKEKRQEKLAKERGQEEYEPLKRGRQSTQECTQIVLEQHDLDPDLKEILQIRRSQKGQYSLQFGDLDKETLKAILSTLFKTD
ncbi:MAG: hypothetical protein K0S74_1831 [Chlamydiales bacterium]|jgi:hypothetical protein|nr:hypothetical protein [Chlamydiales bacterium]